MEIAGMFFAGMATAVFFGGLTMFLVAIVREGLAHRRSKSRPRSGPVGGRCTCGPPEYSALAVQIFGHRFDCALNRTHEET